MKSVGCTCTVSGYLMKAVGRDKFRAPAGGPSSLTCQSSRSEFRGVGLLSELRTG